MVYKIADHLLQAYDSIIITIIITTPPTFFQHSFSCRNLQRLIDYRCKILGNWVAIVWRVYLQQNSTVSPLSSPIGRKYYYQEWQMHQSTSHHQTSVTAYLNKY